MNLYFKRYAYPDQLFSYSPASEVRIIVVIPCFNEPDIILTLESLNSCQAIHQAEVMLIVNESVEANEGVRKTNRKTIAAAENWQNEAQPWFQLLVAHIKMPVKDAGVGLARKAGMDEAARRFESIGQTKGVIACFDADSTCRADYFKAIEKAYFGSEKQPVGSAIYFEHPFPQEPDHRNGIIQYELHLRYYLNALRWIGYPYSFQTVGSSMVVRSDVYQKIGGMNKRKAGEDFYFLHRLIPAGYFTDITTTCIYPSPRISNRVPFGTGKAMAKWQGNPATNYSSYSLKSFIALETLLARINDLYDGNVQKLYNELSPVINDFLHIEKFTEVLTRLRKQSRDLSQFRKNFHAYFDGFKVLKYLHFSRDHYYPDTNVMNEAIELAGELWQDDSMPQDAEGVLNYYRAKDRLL